MSGLYLPDQVLWIVGAGELGLRIGRQWREQFPRGLVLAETRSRLRHEELKEFGLRPLCSGEPLPAQPSHLVVAVPPGGLPDRGSMELLRLRLSRYGAPPANHPESKILPAVWISSTAVYAEEQGQEITETAELARTPRAAHLLALEKLGAQACPGMRTVRCGGLYSETRGPHMYYSRVKQVEGRSQTWLNLIYEEDAARIAIAALLKGQAGGTYVATDGHPVTRAELVRRSFGRLDHLKFTEDSEGYGKQINPSWTLRTLSVQLERPEFSWPA